MVILIAINSISIIVVKNCINIIFTVFVLYRQYLLSIVYIKLGLNKCISLSLSLSCKVPIHFICQFSLYICIWLCVCICKCIFLLVLLISIKYFFFYNIWHFSSISHLFSVHNICLIYLTSGLDHLPFFNHKPFNLCYCGPSEDHNLVFKLIKNS